MDVLPVLGTSFFIFFPVVTAIMVAIFAFQLHIRLMKSCGISTHSGAGVNGGGEADQDSVLKEGIALIQEHKTAMDARSRMCGESGR
mgnify:CR=1 FL=1